MKTVTIIWAAFGAKPKQGKAIGAATITVPETYANVDICEQVYAATNLYSGPLWDQIEAVLPPNRTHTALSVGDYVIINDDADRAVRTYRCASAGFSEVH